MQMKINVMRNIHRTSHLCERDPGCFWRMKWTVLGNRQQECRVIYSAGLEDMEPFFCD